MYGYIYKFTFLPTGKFYVGKHRYSGNNLDENYWGSGTAWNKDIDEYINSLDKESLLNLNYSDIINREILCWCSDEQDLNDKEQYWILKLNAQNLEIAYNLTSGGNGGTGKGCEWYNDGKTEFYINVLVGELPNPNWVKGRLKDRFKNINKDTIWINNGIEQKHIPFKKAKRYLDTGWVEGMLDRGQEWLQHVIENHHVTEYQRRISSETAKKTIAEGRNPGWIANQFKCGETSYNKDLIWITNGVENTYISKDSDLPDGFKYGCTQSKKRIRKVLNIDTGEVFSSVREANIAYNIKHDVCRCCNGRLETAAGYHWRYIEDTEDI